MKNDKKRKKTSGGIYSGYSEYERGGAGRSADDVGGA